MTEKIIYSVKPHKDGYKISRYVWSVIDRRYTDISVLALRPDKESAEIALKGIKDRYEQNGYKATIERTKKWTFLTLERD